LQGNEFVPVGAFLPHDQRCWLPFIGGVNAVVGEVDESSSTGAAWLLFRPKADGQLATIGSLEAVGLV